MDFARTFWRVTRYARAARFWLLLALAGLAWCGIGRAEAQNINVPQVCANLGGNTTCDEGQAYAACVSHVDQIKAFVIANPDRFTQLQKDRWATAYCGKGNVSGDVQPWLSRDSTGGSPPQPPAITRMPSEYFLVVKTCAARDASTTIFNPKPGSVGCVRNCLRSYYSNGDGETMTEQSVGPACTLGPEMCSLLPPERGNFVWNPYLKVCEPVAPECPEGERHVNGRCEPNDFCPVGQILNEHNVCVPREGECPAGTTRNLEGMCESADDDGEPNKCPEGQVKGSDGTCKPDDDDDGEPDDGSDTGTFNGGDNCKVPPMCSGDAILCGQAKIQWRIDCNTRRNQKISGGGCAPNSMPVCVGESCDLMQYAQLMQAWNTRCAVEKLAAGAGTGNGQEGDADFDGDAEGTGAAGRLGDDGLTADDAFTDESENNGGAGGAPGGTGELDDSGLGFSRSCPSLPVISVMGRTVDFNASGVPLCEWMQLGGQFVLLLAAFVSVRILSSGQSV